MFGLPRGVFAMRFTFEQWIRSRRRDEAANGYGTMRQRDNAFIEKQRPNCVSIIFYFEGELHSLSNRDIHGEVLHIFNERNGLDSFDVDLARLRQGCI